MPSESDNESDASIATTKQAKMDQIAAMKLQRKSLRSSCTLEAKKINDLVTITDANIEQAVVTVAKLKRVQSAMAEIDQYLLMNGGYAEPTKEIERADEYQDSATSAIEILSFRVDKYRQLEAVLISQTNVPPSASAAANVTAALPGTPTTPTASAMKKPKLQELHLTTFDGEPMNFLAFWDDFTSTVDSRQDYSQADKFKYLKEALKGRALEAVGGYVLTDANYDQVKAELKERFGNPEIAIFSHFMALLDLLPASNDLKQLTKTRDQCETHVRSLITLGLDEATFGRVFCPIILSKLPHAVRVELYRKNGDETWQLQNLRKLLREEVMARENSARLSHEVTSGKNGNSPGRNGPRNTPGTGSSLMSHGNQKFGKPRYSKRKCALCDGNHYEDKCTTYSTVDQRRSRIYTLKLCVVCLRSDHIKPNCRNVEKYVCSHCNGTGHNRCVCNTLRNGYRNGANQGAVNVGIASRTFENTNAGSSGQGQLNPDTPAFVPTDTHVANSARHATLSKKGHAVMETCVATVQGGRSAAKARFLFDSASTRSFIKASVSKAIGAKIVGQEATAIARLGEEQRRDVSYTICSVDICLPNGKLKPLLLSQIETISTPIRLFPLNGSDVPLLSGLFMAEGLVRQPCDVQLDILIGLDYYYEFVGPVVAHLNSGLVLKSTIIGHLVTGFQVEQWSDQSCALTMLTLEDDTVECDLQRFWSIEELGIKDDPVKGDDDRALDYFNKSIKYEDGRYQVKWLFREGMKPESDNRLLSEGRLRSLHRRLAQQPETLDMYDKTIQDQIAKGIVEVAPEQPNGLVHYIPHHHVIKETSATTKLRIVYDASAKSRKDQHSLNECLYRGPVILADMGGMLMRLRLPKIAMAADIEKAFLQVGLQREDRDATRFLWLKDCFRPPTHDNVVTLRFTRVPFGFATSSFLLDGTIAHHLRLRGSSLALQVLRDLFVDNVQGGRETPREAITFYREVKQMFEDASMNLRERFSNSKEFVSSIPETDRGKGKLSRFLGLIWDTERDTLSVTVGKGAAAETATKRGVLKGIASTFDPCGWFAPVVCVGKILMQDIWKRALGWDEQLPDELTQRWKAIQADILQLQSQRVPRYTGASVYSDESQISLHCFCDASSQAYGSVVYLVVIDEGRLTSTLLCAKSRVCPLKEVSMPRLELIAVVMGTKLVRYVKGELHVTVANVYVWTDSKCVLWWIARDSVKERFVENRLEQIRDPHVEFRYVPTSENPADIASRGLALNKLIESELWWRGPPWLLLQENAWPTRNLGSAPDEGTVAVVNEERQAPAPTDDGLLDLQRFSTLTKLVRTMAYVLRFCKKLTHNFTFAEHLRFPELREATTVLERLVQSDAFGTMPLSKERANLFSQLGVYKDAHGILRCRGRLDSADVSAATKDPILLPKSHHFVRLVIEDAHRRVLHSGVKHTLAETRLRYWVVHGRREVRKVLSKCRKCRRYQGASFQVPRPPPLPNFRVSIQRPFSHVGLDYAGPVLLRDGEAPAKAWICLFTCAAIRAVHLELVTNLTTEDFLFALRRFSALYGKSSLIVSDNGSQFRSADRFLRKLATAQSVQDYSSNAGIAWQFIPEMAPWMGGMYERLISPVKRALRRCVGSKLLSATELQTVLYEIAAVLNSRPLAQYESDEVGEQALTPNHFLLRAQWEPVAAVDRQLIPAGARANPRVSPVGPREGQIVLVSEKKAPRGTWRLAKITKLIPSADGECRTVEVKYANGKVSRRPIKLLHPLESSEVPQPLVPQQAGDLVPLPPDQDEEYDEELLASCSQGL